MLRGTRTQRKLKRVRQRSCSVRGVRGRREQQQWPTVVVGEMKMGVPLWGEGKKVLGNECLKVKYQITFIKIIEISLFY